MATAGVGTVSRSLPVAALAVSVEETDPFADEDDALPVLADAANDGLPGCSANGGSVSERRGPESEAVQPLLFPLTPREAARFTHEHRAQWRHEVDVSGQRVTVAWMGDQFSDCFFVHVVNPEGWVGRLAVREIDRQMRELPNGTRLKLLMAVRVFCQVETFVVWDGLIYQDPQGSYQREVKS